MHVTTQLGMPGLQTTSSQTINGWWKRMCRSFDKKQKPTFDGLILYFCGIFGKNAIEGSSSITPCR
jgi:hypothetical protein